MFKRQVQTLALWNFTLKLLPTEVQMLQAVVTSQLQSEINYNKIVQTGKFLFLICICRFIVVDLQEIFFILEKQIRPTGSVGFKSPKAKFNFHRLF